MDKLLRTNACTPKECLSVVEVARFQLLDKEFNSIRKVRDDKKAERRKMKDTLDAYRQKRKQDPNSVHNAIERLACENGLDRGATFGGKYNGKVARKVMQNSEPIYSGVCAILNARKAEHISDAYIDNLCEKTVTVMKSWNEFFKII